MYHQNVSLYQNDTMYQNESLYQNVSLYQNDTSKTKIWEALDSVRSLTGPAKPIERKGDTLV